MKAKNNYGIFYTGCASTPQSIGIIDWSTNEKLVELIIKSENGKKIREEYRRKEKLLIEKFSYYLNQ